jgi:hypothetical protein
MAASPHARASFLKDALRTLDLLEPPRAAAAWAAMPRETAARIERAARLDWLPAGCALDILRSIEVAAGDEGVRRCSIAAMEATLGAPLLRAFVEAALGALHVTPRALARAVAGAWPLHYRHSGDLVVGDAPGRGVRVVHAGIPDALREPCWLLSMASCLGRAAQVVAPDVRVELDDGRTVAYTVRWGEVR